MIHVDAPRRCSTSILHVDIFLDAPAESEVPMLLEILKRHAIRHVSCNLDREEPRGHWVIMAAVT